ncbi:MAG TPA: ABC transporter ATP-binding protein [Clostridia bacterium]|jgi:energy-coupling factor transport system ATP-binding protein|nr:ABC transporter ATP-binding protein [Clostridia bacterium]
MQIKLENLSFKYNKKSPFVLSNITYTFETGKLYALKGPNGAGKTTLGKLILGLLHPTSGDIYFDDINAKKISAGKRADSIGYLFQNPDLQLFAPTVIEELTFPFELKKELTDEKRAEINLLLKDFNLSGFEDRYPLSMSLGEKQRLALATIMSRNVDFLILDEPTSSIDSEGILFITTFINGFVNKGGGAIIISHDEEFLSSLNNVTNLHLHGGVLDEKN